MNKAEYQERSRNLRVPQRCPLVGYCQRWAWTVYFYCYMDPSNPTENIRDVLRKAGDLPDDYDQKKVTLAVESPETSRGDDYHWAHNLCPEVPLFDRQHTPGHIPDQAIASFSWLEGSGMEYVEHKHFAECLEFIQSPGIKPKPKRKSLSSKLRFQILQRDSFRCTYCGKSAKDGELHIDHKTSVKDGGTDELDNLVTSCTDCNFGKGADSL